MPPDLDALNQTSQLALTVRGRKTNRPYTVKVWFTVGQDNIYVTSGRGSNSSWVKNLRHKSEVELQIGTTRLRGRAAWLDPATVESEVLPRFFRKYWLARILRLRWIGGWYREKFAFAITPLDD
jgi:deazaflavin-dependent oxidoreductase (nitroreductase family)